MKQSQIKLIALIYAALACLAGGVLIAEPALVTYPAPEGAALADDFDVKVNGKETAVYDSEIAAFTYFSFDRNVSVSVTSGRDIEAVDIRPKSRSIPYSVKDKTISFQLDRPCNLSIEINGDIKRPLFLFANPLEQNPPKSGDKNVRYFDAGRIHQAGEIKLGSNETIYIAGGAIVRGRIRAEGAETPA